MATDAIDDAADGLDAELPRKKLSGKKLVLFVLLPILVIGGGGGALLVAGVLDPFLGGAESEAHGDDHGEDSHGADDHGAGAPSSAHHEVDSRPPPNPEDFVFFDLPDMVVNLETGERRQGLMSLKITLELGSDADIPTIERVMPRVTDAFQVFLRGLSRDDLEGSVGLQRIKEELLRRVNAAAYPAQVQDVLFRELLVQ